MKKIIAISDLHGHLPTLPKGDVLCICGDIFPLDIQTQILECDDWLNNVFIPWTIELPYKEIILLAGNHDFYFKEATPEYILSTFNHTKIIYLCDSWVTIYGIKFYGTPWCKQFGNWAFMEDNITLESKFKNIPEDVDFLLTHDAPYGTSDICTQDIYWNNGDHIGSKPLRDAIIEKKPKYNLHGHLHSSNHDKEILNETKVYNVSLLDENYNLTYKPSVVYYESN